MKAIRIRQRAARWALLFGSGLSATVGCGKDSGDAAGGPNACVSTRDYFVKTAWPEVFAKSCLKCHAPDGLASDKNAKLKLLPPAYPGFLDASLESVAAIAKVEVDGKSTLLRKPIGELEHGGDQVIGEGGPEYAVLSELVSRIKAGDPCPSETVAPSFAELELLDAPATVRKAALHLVGRLPTQAEIDTATSQGDAALPELLAAMMREPAFAERLKEIFNDQLLTDQFLGYSGYAANILNDEDFPKTAPEA